MYRRDELFGFNTTTVQLVRNKICTNKSSSWQAAHKINEVANVTDYLQYSSSDIDWKLYI